MIHTILLPALLLAAPEPLQPQVTVTAARQPQAIDQALSSVELIEREDVVRSQARDLLELLRSRGGIDLARQGGPGQQTSLFLRGTNSNHVLVLIDGVRVAASNAGIYSFEQLPLAHVERIEIVRGPRAALYGSDAIGGVIQVFTRSGPGSQLLASAGSYRDGELAVGHGWGAAESSLRLSASRRDRRGFSAQNEAGFGFDPDRDGVESTRVALAGRHRFGDSVSAQLDVLAIDSEVEFDQGLTDVDNRSIALGFEHLLSESWTQQLLLGQAREDLFTPAFFQRFYSDRRQLDWTHRIELATDQQFGFGLNLLRDEGFNADPDGNRAYGEARDSHGLYGRYARQQEALSMEAAARYDHYDGFGSEFTGQLAFGWRFDGGSVYLNGGEGFRAPNLNELFSPGFGGLFAGNPALEPERSRSIELGARFNLADHGRIETQVYRSRIRELIAFEGGDVFQAINIARAEIDGAEASWTLEREAWRSRLGYTFTDAVNGTTGSRLLRRARHKAAFEFDYDFAGGFSLGTELTYFGRRAEFGGDLASYALATLRGRYAFGSSGWTVEARLDNLGDEDYELARGFNTAGRGAQISVRYGD